MYDYLKQTPVEMFIEKLFDFKKQKFLFFSFFFLLSCQKQFISVRKENVKIEREIANKIEFKMWFNFLSFLFCLTNQKRNRNHKQEVVLNCGF